MARRGGAGSGGEARRREKGAARRWRGSRAAGGMLHADEGLQQGIRIASAGKAKDLELDGGICELNPTSACRGPGALNRCIGARAAGGEQVSGFFLLFFVAKILYKFFLHPNFFVLDTNFFTRVFLLFWIKKII